MALNASLSGAVRRCRLKPDEPHVESAWCQRLKLNCAEQVSSFAFNLNLRRYRAEEALPMGEIHGLGRAVQVDSINTRVESAYGFIA